VKVWSTISGAIGMAACLGLSACGGSSAVKSIPQGEAAYKLVPPADPAAETEPYVIAPNDLLDLRVFQEPDLSNENLRVDDTGRFQMPLIGDVYAAGRTPAELAAEIATRLRERYIVNPQVVISVAKGAVQFITVEGHVNKPGVYEISRNYTLLSAIARAESPSKTGKLDEIMVFRTVDKQRYVARFDLKQIRIGQAPDPKIIGGDVIVVGYSQTKGLVQNVLQAVPLLNIFYLLRL
jgi:polysaccharide biosynthesis/export protein